jgi:hypothetical protein
MNLIATWSLGFGDNQTLNAKNCLGIKGVEIGNHCGILDDNLGCTIAIA